MSSWIASHFFNPAYLYGGAALIAVPIIIHLINRMRYKTVRFAAMEFLLASEQRNRRRLLLEQLLLLAMRVAMVAAVVLLLARLVLDPSQLTAFQGATAHHLVLLDDSLSMRERQGESVVFDEALAVVRQIATEGAKRPMTQRLSVVLLSRPEQPLITDRDVNQPLVSELHTKLDPQNIKASHQPGNLLSALETCRKLLEAEKTNIKQLHLVSDYRQKDWLDEKTMTKAISSLTDAEIGVDLIKTARPTRGNLAVTELSAPTQIAAAGVSLRVRVGVTNFGDQVASDVRIALYDDGVKLPATVVLDKIEPLGQATTDVDVRLATATPHRLEATVEPDPLVEDNSRFLVIDVAPSIPVLLIDGEDEYPTAQYIADALATDPASTGVSVTIDGIDGLRRRQLNNYRAVYLLNTGELPLDAIDAAERYVKGGGGLVWWLGPKTNSSFSNRLLYTTKGGLFPVPLGNGAQPLVADETLPGPDLAQSTHPLFRVFQGDENPFTDSVHINRYWPASDEWKLDDSARLDGVTTIATLRNRAPLLLEHLLGQGKIVTCLTTADPVWNDWATNPSFVVLQLDLLAYVAKVNEEMFGREVGEAINVQLDPSRYSDQIELVAPRADGSQTLRLTAAPERETASGTVSLVAKLKETDRPGFYTLRQFPLGLPQTETPLAFNVAPGEGDLRVIDTAALRKRFSDNSLVTVHDVGGTDWAQSREAGSEIRYLLLACLGVLLVAEQALARRLSFHGGDKVPSSSTGPGYRASVRSREVAA